MIEPSPGAEHPRQPGLLQAISRSVFWNTALLPLVAFVGMLLSVLVRRRFGLESGYYDVALGFANSLLFYSSLGLSGSLPRFVPQLQVTGGTRAAAQLIARLAVVRLAVVAALLVVTSVWAEPIAQGLGLGAGGALSLRVLAGLVLGRATLDFAYRALESFFRHFAVNVLSLVHGVLDVAFVAVTIGLGMHITGVIGALSISALVMAVVTAIVVMRHVRALPATRIDVSDTGGLTSRIWKFSAVTYIRDLSTYVATPAFASPVLLKTLGGPEPVAIFATSYFVASATVTLVVSGFRGIYRPAFAHVMATGERAQLKRAFDLMNKMQILAVVPAGTGLAVMVADYLPLLYGEPFAAAVPTARLLVVLLFAETALAVALLVLWVDERYGPVLLAQGMMIASIPLFVWASARFGLLPAALILGGSRLASSVLGYIEARRLYGVRYPWRFAARVGGVSLIMAAVLTFVRAVWPTSAIEAATCTLLGALVVALCLRLFHVLSPGELELLGRTSIPGRHLLLRFLDPDGRARSRAV